MHPLCPPPPPHPSAPPLDPRSWWGKVIVLAVFAGYIVMTGVGIPRLQEGQPLSELAPDDSFLQDYVEVMEVGHGWSCTGHVKVM